ncbi:hypothetical protein ACS0TY_009048 [Phlomoides rotata]
MALKEITLSSSLTILATFLLLSTTAIAGTSGGSVNPFCKSATDGVLCTAMAKGAANWGEAMTNVISSAIENAKARQSLVYGIAGQDAS